MGNDITRPAAQPGSTVDVVTPTLQQRPDQLRERFKQEADVTIAMLAELKWKAKGNKEYQKGYDDALAALAKLESAGVEKSIEARREKLIELRDYFSKGMHHPTFEHQLGQKNYTMIVAGAALVLGFLALRAWSKKKNGYALPAAGAAVAGYLAYQAWSGNSAEVDGEEGDTKQSQPSSAQPIGSEASATTPAAGGAAGPGASGVADQNAAALGSHIDEENAQQEKLKDDITEAITAALPLVGRFDLTEEERVILEKAIKMAYANEKHPHAEGFLAAVENVVNNQPEGWISMWMGETVDRAGDINDQLPSVLTWTLPLALPLARRAAVRAFLQHASESGDVLNVLRNNQRFLKLTQTKRPFTFLWQTMRGTKPTGIPGVDLADRLAGVKGAQRVADARLAGVKKAVGSAHKKAAQTQRALEKAEEAVTAAEARPLTGRGSAGRQAAIDAAQSAAHDARQTHSAAEKAAKAAQSRLDDATRVAEDAAESVRYADNFHRGQIATEFVDEARRLEVAANPALQAINKNRGVLLGELRVHLQEARTHKQLIKQLKAEAGIAGHVPGDALAAAEGKLAAALHAIGNLRKQIGTLASQYNNIADTIGNAMTAKDAAEMLLKSHGMQMTDEILGLLNGRSVDFLSEIGKIGQIGESIGAGELMDMVRRLDAVDQIRALQTVADHGGEFMHVLSSLSPGNQKALLSQLITMEKPMEHLKRMSATFSHIPGDLTPTIGRRFFKNILASPKTGVQLVEEVTHAYGRMSKLAKLAHFAPPALDLVFIAYTLYEISDQKEILEGLENADAANAELARMQFLRFRLELDTALGALYFLGAITGTAIPLAIGAALVNETVFAIFETGREAQRHHATESSEWASSKTATEIAFLVAAQEGQTEGDRINHYMRSIGIKDEAGRYAHESKDQQVRTRARLIRAALILDMGLLYSPTVPEAQMTQRDQEQRRVQNQRANAIANGVLNEGDKDYPLQLEFQRRLQYMRDSLGKKLDPGTPFVFHQKVRESAQYLEIYNLTEPYRVLMTLSAGDPLPAPVVKWLTELRQMTNEEPGYVDDVPPNDDILALQRELYAQLNDRPGYGFSDSSITLVGSTHGENLADEFTEYRGKTGAAELNTNIHAEPLQEGGEFVGSTHFALYSFLRNLGYKGKSDTDSLRKGFSEELAPVHGGIYWDETWRVGSGYYTGWLGKKIDSTYSLACGFDGSLLSQNHSSAHKTHPARITAALEVAIQQQPQKADEYRSKIEEYEQYWREWKLDSSGGAVERSPFLFAFIEEQVSGVSHDELAGSEQNTIFWMRHSSIRDDRVNDIVESYKQTLVGARDYYLDRRDEFSDESDVPADSEEGASSTASASPVESFDTQTWDYLSVQPFEDLGGKDAQLQYYRTLFTLIEQEAFKALPDDDYGVLAAFDGASTDLEQVHLLMGKLLPAGAQSTVLLRNHHKRLTGYVDNILRISLLKELNWEKELKLVVEQIHSYTTTLSSLLVQQYFTGRREVTQTDVAVIEESLGSVAQGKVDPLSRADFLNGPDFKEAENLFERHAPSEGSPLSDEYRRYVYLEVRQWQYMIHFYEIQPGQSLTRLPLVDDSMRSEKPKDPLVYLLSQHMLDYEEWLMMYHGYSEDEVDDLEI